MFLFATLLVAGAVCLYIGLDRSGPPGVPQFSGVRFTPNSSTGYWVAAAPVPPLSLGDQLSFTGQSPLKIDLPIVFPFAGKLWNEVFISPNGLVSFGGPGENNLFRSGQLPAIAPYNMSLSLNAGGVFTANGPGQFAVTWYKLRPSTISFGPPDNPQYTFQLILGEDGTIVFRYYEVGQDANIKTGGETTWVAVLTGKGLAGVDKLDLPVEQSFDSRASGGLLDRLHTGQNPQTYWLIASGVALAASVFAAGFGIRRRIHREQYFLYPEIGS